MYCFLVMFYFTNQIIFPFLLTTFQINFIVFRFTILNASVFSHNQLIIQKFLNIFFIKVSYYGGIWSSIFYYIVNNRYRSLVTFMIVVTKSSILTMPGYRLVSLSHSVNIGNNSYYLVELCHDISRQFAYTWEEISIIKSKFPEANNPKILIERGKKLQLKYNWPSAKQTALKQIRQKFWDEESLDSQSEEQEGDADIIKVGKDRQKKGKGLSSQIVRKLMKNGNIRNDRQKSISVEQRSRNKQMPKQMIQSSQKKNIKKTYEQIGKQTKKAEPNDQKQQSMQTDKSPAEYYQIVAVQPNKKDKKHVIFVVRDVLGEQKRIPSTIFRKTHFTGALEWLEQHLGVKK